MKKNANYVELSKLQRYLNEIGEIPTLTKDEEQELGFLLLQGDEEAKKKLIESNLKLVICIAKKYIGRGLNVEDLIEEGNLALHDAISNFDVQKGVSVSTYVGKCIDGRLKDAIADYSRNIKIRRNYFYLLYKIVRMRNTMFNISGHFPNDDELSKKMGLKTSLVKLLLKYKDDTVTLNQMIKTTDGYIELGNSIVDSSVDIENEIIMKDFMQEMNGLFNSDALSPIEREVLYNHYRLNLTFAEIGKNYGITRQAINRIEKKALNELRKIIDVDAMSLYLDYPERGREFVKAKVL